MRRTVALLCLAGSLPIIILGAAFGAATLINERSGLAANVEGRTRYSAALIGRELASDKRATDMMAQSPAFDGGFDLGRFRLLAGRLVARQPEWRRIRVSDDAGKTLLEIPEITGQGAPSRVIDRDSFQWAIGHKLPDIGRVVPGPGGTFAFPVRAPVVRDGHVTHVVTTVIPASTLNLLLLDQKLPAGWRAELVDGQGHIVASTDTGDRQIGSSAARATLLARHQERTSFYSIERSNGASEVAMWAPVPATNWTVHIAAPSQLFSAPLHRAVTLIIVAALVSILLFFLLLRLLVREIRQTRLREAAELQSHRMEALGRLTGGVAHDFNNLLTPIVGGLDLLKRRLGDDARSMKYIDAAMQSADRAKMLVGRLLAYSRRQPLAPRLVDIPAMIGGLMELLDRSTGPHISFDTRFATNLPSVKADPAQLELCLLNLAINARDAMPEGGTITIEAETGDPAAALELVAGRYVGLSVVDTGVGMDAATLSSATEPFFTTKTVERGTGLGLSMVQGFAAQSGGALELTSAPGSGTRATIWLPTATAAECASSKQELSKRDSVGRSLGAGRILLVDDEPEVRTIAADGLADLGYSVVVASSMREALRVFEQEQPFDLLISDYLMPGGSGAELIRAIRATHPAMPVLLLSGFIEATADIDNAIPRLAKPYSIDDLAGRVATLLSSADKPGPAAQACGDTALSPISARHDHIG